MRSIDLERNTKETQIKLSLNLDGSVLQIYPWNYFFAHMLDQLVRHGDFDLQLNAVVILRSMHIILLRTLE